MNFFGRKSNVKAGRREPRFAGTWYDDNKERLAEQLTRFFADAEADIEKGSFESSFADNGFPDGSLYGVISPHAGYHYSGSTAAYSYELARRAAPRRVFLLGPSHYIGFQGAALSPDASFGTPLGDLPLARDVVDELAQYPMFEVMPEVHAKEHSLELQLSMIRFALGEVELVPLIIGLLPDITEVRLLGQIIRRYMKPGDLVVVSSDFTHFGPRFEYVPFNDDLVNNVRKLDEEAFGYLRSGDLSGFMEFHDRTRCTICGYYPCAVLLAMLPDTVVGGALKYRTSRDVTQDDGENSVSYLAIGFGDLTTARAWEEEQSGEASVLSNSEVTSLFKLARSVIENYVKDGTVTPKSELPIELTQRLKQPLGVFVTLFKKVAIIEVGQRDKELRGCIGYIWPIKPLYEAVIDNSIGSCSKDHRFVPVREEELASIEIEISVLTPPRRVESKDEIEIGKHGIVLYVKGRQSVFLPHVATEFGWTLEETLDQLSMKAGLPADEWRRGAQFDVFESVMFDEHY